MSANISSARANSVLSSPTGVFSASRTILSVGAGDARPLVRDGKIEAAQVMTVGLSTDHRAVDGALGAELLGAFRQFIENPVMMLV